MNQYLHHTCVFANRHTYSDKHNLCSSHTLVTRYLSSCDLASYVGLPKVFSRMARHFEIIDMKHYFMSLRRRISKALHLHCTQFVSLLLSLAGGRLCSIIEHRSHIMILAIPRCSSFCLQPRSCVGKSSTCFHFR
jgi:hypothetical protein